MKQDTKWLLALLGLAAALYLATWLIAGSPFEQEMSGPTSLGPGMAIEIAAGASSQVDPVLQPDFP